MESGLLHHAEPDRKGVLRIHSAAVATAAPAPDGPNDAIPPWRWRGFGFAIVIVALLGGIGLRVIAPSPLWLDEALSVNIASLGFGDMVDALRHDGHPALYYLLLGWWIDLFGDSDTAVRALSGLFSLATVPVLWAAARRHGEAIAGTAAVLALTSPFLLRYGTEARMYALLALLVAVAWLAVEAARDDPRPLRLSFVAVTVAALIHTHYWSFWVIGAALLAIGWTAVRGEPAARATARRVTAAIIVGSVSFVVWLGVFFDQLSSTGTPWADRARPAEVAIEALQALGGNNRFEGELLGLIVAMLAVVGATAVAPRGKHLVLGISAGPLHRALLMVLLTLGLGGGVALLTAGAFEARYTAVVVAFVLVLAARGIVMLPGRAATAALAVTVLFGLAVGADEARRDRTQAADVAAAIDAGWQPGDVVAFCPDQLGPSTLRLVDSDAETFAYPRGDGHLVDWSDYADVIEALPAEVFVEEVLDAADGHDVWAVVITGRKSLDSRCAAIADLLGRALRPDHLVVPTEAFESMILTRYETRQ